MLSGGVVKAAAWHLGVALALSELGFSFKSNTSTTEDFQISCYVGSSAGSLINLYLARGFHPQDIISAYLNQDKKKKSLIIPISYRDMCRIQRPHLAKDLMKEYRPFADLPIGLRHLFRPLLNISGLFSTRGIHDYLVRDVLEGTSFHDYLADMFVITSQLDHSRKVIFSKYLYPGPEFDPSVRYYNDVNIADAIAASMSVPPLFAPYGIPGPTSNQSSYYFDGEIRETLSSHVAIDNKAQMIISSWTHTPYHFRSEIGSLVQYGLPAICMQAIYLMIQKKIVTARSQISTAKDVVETVNLYLKNNKFSEKHRIEILSILERKLEYHRDVELIDIFPDEKDFPLFFSSSFAMNPKNPKHTYQLVQKGHHRTIEVFRQKGWTT